MFQILLGQKNYTSNLDTISYIYLYLTAYEVFWKNKIVANKHCLVDKICQMYLPNVFANVNLIEVVSHRSPGRKVIFVYNVVQEEQVAF